jgi:mono/diheme cytochrome c family protein
MRRAFIIIAALAAGLSACSLAGDVTPPPGSRVASGSDSAGGASASGSVDLGLGYPAFKPSASEGALLFAQHCAACHGAAGKGDGERSAQLMSERAEPLPDFSAPDLARQATPFGWYETISLGRLEKLMPPWAQSLTEAERWNLVAFLYTLSTPPEQIEAGGAIYAARCAECHGERGQGDGPQARDPPVPDFTDQAFMASTAPAGFFAAITDGIDGQHVFADLAEDRRWAVVDYVRAFAYNYAAPGTVAASVSGEASVTGSVQNGTAGAAVPGDLVVTLHGFDDFSETVTLSATVSASGAYAFTSVPYIAGRQFILSTRHQGVIYGSDIFSFDLEPTVEMPLVIFDSTTDPGALRVERMHIFFDLTGDGGATVGELFLFSNGGDKTYADAGGPALEIPLPASAADVTVQGGVEGEDYVLAGQGLQLSAPVRPGSSSAQILISFRLPYDRRLDFEQELLYPVNALNVLLPAEGMTLRGGGLQDEGVQEIQGSAFHSYGAAGLAAGNTVSFQLSGQPASAASGAGLLTGSDPLRLGIGVGGLVLALAGVGYWWYLRRSPRTDDEPQDREALLQAIADLDDAFDEGELGEREYERERARLKRQLQKIWEE